MPNDNRVQCASFRRYVRMVVCLTALFPAAARSQTISQPPRLSWDLVAGGAQGDGLYQPTFRGALSARYGSGNRVAPFGVVELATLGSGYRRNVGHSRPDGTYFDAPAFLGGLGAAVGVRAALTTRVLVSGSGGVAMLETSGHPGRFLDADLSVALGSRVAVVGGVRHMWYYDPHAQLNRTYAPVVVGLRFLSRS